MIPRIDEIRSDLKRLHVGTPGLKRGKQKAAHSGFAAAAVKAGQDQPVRRNVRHERAS
jgi:hypothetical protein